MMYLSNVRTVAHYVVNRCYSQGHPISNLQLQKILYFLQVVYCRMKQGGSLLFPERFHAWQYGPVVPEIYHEYSEFGGYEIEMSYDDRIVCDRDTLDFINDGIDMLRQKSPWDLVRISHADGSPWNKVYKGGEGNCAAIDNELIVEAACA